MSELDPTVIVLCNYVVKWPDELRDSLYVKKHNNDLDISALKTQTSVTDRA